MRFRRRGGVLPRVFRLAALALAVTGVLSAAGGAARAQGGGDIFTVRNVSVDETAGTAAEARQVALAVGQRRAFRQLIDRLVPEGQQGLVPDLDANQLQYYVRDFSVDDERTSAVRYLADLTFRFNAEEVRNLLRRNMVGFAEARSKPVLVLPVFQGPEGEATLWLDPNPWRETWARRPGDDGLVPMIVPLGDLGDMAAIDAARALAGEPQALDAIAERYGAEDVIVSEAASSGDPESGSAVLNVTTRRYRDGGVARTLRDKLVQVTGEPYEAFLTRAADRIDSAVQETWKQQNVLQFGNRRSILVYVPLEGLDDWLNVRRRLRGVAAIQHSALSALARDEAQLEITFFGDEQRLTRALAQRDLFLSLRPDSNWELILAEKRAFSTPRTVPEAMPEGADETVLEAPPAAPRAAPGASGAPGGESGLPSPAAQ
jgi:hypothetical protein